MKIINMKQFTPEQIAQAARLLQNAFPAWLPTQQKLQEAMGECLRDENTMLAALEEDTVLGWGGILAPIYDGRVFELHPLVVRKDCRGQGIGRMLVSALEKAAKRQGGITIFLGADDDAKVGETSFAGADLYTDLPGKMAAFTPGVHPGGFYQKLGYTVIGVMPDANGNGKPDIFFGKRL